VKYIVCLQIFQALEWNKVLW